MIGMDWTDPTAMVSQYFSVKEALWLHQWNRLATEADGLTEAVKQNLFNLCSKLDAIRDYLTYPINVNSMFRPLMYNKALGIAPTADVHSMGMACDFVCPGLTCEQIKQHLLPVLETYGIRMENNLGGNWVHVDIHPVIHARYFNV